jgi:hypothetical protein
MCLCVFVCERNDSQVFVVQCCDIPWILVTGCSVPVEGAASIIAAGFEPGTVQATGATRTE